MADNVPADAPSVASSSQVTATATASSATTVMTGDQPLPFDLYGEEEDLLEFGGEGEETEDFEGVGEEEEGEDIGGGFRDEEEEEANEEEEGEDDVSISKKIELLMGSSSNVPEDDEITLEPSKSILIALAEEDAREFDMEMDEYFSKSKFKDKSFQKLTEFFEGVINDLEKTQKVGIPLEEVKEEFYFVWDAIQRSHDNLETLLHKDLQLSVEVADTMARTRNLIKIAEDQPEKAMLLGKRLETAWNLVDISKAEEKRNAARLEELEANIIVLNRNITAAANMEGRAELNELMKIRKKLSEERDSLIKETARLKGSLELLEERQQRQKEQVVSFTEQITFSEEEAVAQAEALERESARKDRILKAIAQIILNVEAKTEEVKAMEDTVNNFTSKITDLETNLRDQKVVNDLASRESEAAWHKYEKLKADVESQISLVERLASDSIKRQQELKAREDEIAILRLEGTRTERQRLANLKKCEAMQETLDALEQERDNLKEKIQELEQDLERAQRRLENSKREVEELDKQRTIVNRNLQRVQDKGNEHEHMMKVHVVAINNLETELDGYKREIVSQTETIQRLERERDYYSHEADKLAHIVSSRVDEIKRLDLSTLEQRRAVGQLEEESKYLQQSYESVIVEKLHCEKQLREIVNDITQCSKTIRNVRFENATLENAEIKVKNSILTEEEHLDRLGKEKAFFQIEAKRVKKMAIDVQRETEALEMERSTLSSAIATAENEMSKQRYYAKSAESRKENYHRRWMQKEQELRKAWERWRILHSMVRIGAYHYRNLMREIREIRQSIVTLRCEQVHYKGNKNHVAQLRQEISALETCIAKETCMVNALVRELQRPINIHRWRVLEAIDPDAYNLVKKINIVTKRLVDHNEQIRRQNLRISDQEHIYVDIKRITRHLPGLETPEERKHYEVLYAAKKEQLKALRHEMHSNEAKTAFFRGQVAELSQRMEEIRQDYFDKKRLELCTRRRGKGHKICTLLAKRILEKKRRPINEEEEEMEAYEEVEGEQEFENDEEEEQSTSSSSPTIQTLPPPMSAKKVKTTYIKPAVAVVPTWKKEEHTWPGEDQQHPFYFDE